MMMDPVQLEIFKHLFAAVAEEMGTLLRKSSYSTNIKERRDFSCAVFDSRGRMVAQAAHIPVHLGAMPLSVRAAVERFAGDLDPGDLVVLNDPFQGGTHLPDITMVSPVFLPARGEAISPSGHLDPGAQVPDRESLVGYVASRAHHADVGGMTPGSMPVAREIYQEGLIIPPVKLVHRGEVDSGLTAMILANVRTPAERQGDLLAQMAANQRGVERLGDLVTRYGLDLVDAAMLELIAYTARCTHSLLASLPNGTYRFRDVLDDDGFGSEPIPICVAITISGETAQVDFSGSAPQQQGSINAVEAITLSAVNYVFRCLLGLDVPNNAGCLEPIQVFAPPGTVVNALPPAAVAGGNVETSQRIVDVLLGALALACPGKIPAASQGTMNNVTIGGKYPSPAGIGPVASRGQEGLGSFAYYETIGGGSGATPFSNGLPAVHTHMTNTLNTPVEALEYAYPLRLRRYAIRRGSGGQGRFNGGDGIVREIEVLAPCQVTLLSERRRQPPYGLAGGNPGACGENLLIHGYKETLLPGKGTVELEAGDVISIKTPGGGGYGGRSS